jgi:hypothetical protein
MNDPNNKPRVRMTPQQAKILEEFNGRVYEPDRMDVQEGRLWDSFQASAGATLTKSNTQLFTYVSGVDHKTLADTNLISPRRLYAPEVFSVRRVMFTFSKICSDVDLYSFAEMSVWSLWLGQKYYLRSTIMSMRPVDSMLAPFRTCEFCRSVYVQNIRCPGCGANSFSLVASDAIRDNAGRQFIMDLSQNIVIENGSDFYVDFDFPEYTLKHTLKLWCHFEGLHARGVQ